MSFPNPTAKAFGSLIDLTTQERYEFDWNPTEMNESVEARYARQVIPGLSHQRSQFLNTENRTIEFTLVLDGNVHGGPMVVEEVRNFLLSTMYPRASNRIEGAGAPKMLLLLPGTFRSKGFIDSVRITHKLYYQDMKLRRFEATVKFTEEPEKRLTSNVIRHTTLTNRATGNFIDFRNFPAFSTRIPSNDLDFTGSPPFSTRDFDFTGSPPFSTRDFDFTNSPPFDTNE